MFTSPFSRNRISMASVASLNSSKLGALWLLFFGLSGVSILRIMTTLFCFWMRGLGMGGPSTTEGGGPRRPLFMGGAWADLGSILGMLGLSICGNSWQVANLLPPYYYLVGVKSVAQPREISIHFIISTQKREIIRITTWSTGYNTQTYL